MTWLDLQPAPRIPSPLIASNYGTSVSIIGKYRSDARPADFVDRLTKSRHPKTQPQLKTPQFLSPLITMPMNLHKAASVLAGCSARLTINCYYFSVTTRSRHNGIDPSQCTAPNRVIASIPLSVNCSRSKWSGGCHDKRNRQTPRCRSALLVM